MLSTISDIIGSGAYIFKPSKEKLKILEDKDTSIEEKTKIIKSLSPQIKKEQLKLLFDFENNYDLLFEEGIRLFKSLSHDDKLKALSSISNEKDKRELINYMSHRDFIRILIDQNLDDKSRKYIISLLTQNERKMILNFPFYVYTCDFVEILKYYPEEYIKKILIKKTGRVHSLSDGNKLELLKSLSSDEEKLECLSVPNKYKINPSYYEKVGLIFSLSDSKKQEFINGSRDNLFKLETYSKKDLIKTLTDESKIYYLNNPDLLPKLLYHYESEFLSSFSAKNSINILMNRDSYNFKFDNKSIVALINNLDTNEKLEFLKGENQYNINLDIDQKCEIINKLPNKYKLDIINQQNTYNLDLEEKHIVKIIKSMNSLSIINLLVLNENIELKLSKKSMWEIIENSNKSDVIKILNSDDIRIKKFVEEYKTSFVKCLNDEEKIKIVCDKSSYDIHLEDERKIKIIKSISSSDFEETLLTDNIFKHFDNPKKIIDDLIKDKIELNKLHELFQNQLTMYLMNTDINNEDIEVGLGIIKYTSDPCSILSKYDLFKEVLKKLNINIYDFFQYGSNSNKYKWYENITNIINTNSIEEFSGVKDYFFNNYYNITGDSKGVIQSFLEILNAYDKYGEFCINLVNENKVLSKEAKEDIRYLFNLSDVDNVPTKLEEITAIRNEKIKSCIYIAQNSKSLFELKDTLLKLLFDKSFYDIQKLIDYTGGTAELKILKFNNKNNPGINRMAESLILVTSLMERIINIDNIDVIRKLLEFYCKEENLEDTKKLCNYCSKYEEFNRKLYECDLNASLTDINNIDHNLCNTAKAKEFSKKYHGKVIDLSEVQYVLGAHVKNYREDVRDLLSGNCDGKSNFISLSPVSHRGQHYYCGWDYSKIVFAYDNIPNDSFICSSITNMGSNWILKHNSTEIPEISRKQKNVLETSEAITGNNAEILLYRSNLKPCGLIVPDGTLPSEEAIKYHKEFNLPFIITQPIDKRIDNPIRLDTENKKELDIENVFDIDGLKKVKNILSKCNDKSDTKRIAIISDPHALYEPTLACLVDIKNKGINEIYSLGDNIGHGPNPKEVLDLLKEYGVKSIYGNHELYLINGIDEFKEHFPSDEAIERTVIMNEWMKKELSKHQIKNIKGYPEKYEIPIPGDKKLTLIHTTKPYNIVGKYNKYPEIDKNSFVIKGHEHFASKGINEITLKGVGIGQTLEYDGMATYYILNITDNNYSIDSVNISYDRDNLLHTINESDMPILAKSLISDWVGDNKK